MTKNPKPKSKPNPKPKPKPKVEPKTKPENYSVNLNPKAVCTRHASGAGHLSIVCKYRSFLNPEQLI